MCLSNESVLADFLSYTISSEEDRYDIIIDHTRQMSRWAVQVHGEIMPKTANRFNQEDSTKVGNILSTDTIQGFGGRCMKCRLLFQCAVYPLFLKWIGYILENASSLFLLPSSELVRSSIKGILLQLEFWQKHVRHSLHQGSKKFK